MLKDKLVGPLGMAPEAMQAREKYDYPLYSTVPALPTFPPSPSSSSNSPPSYRISLTWDIDNENMVRVTQAPQGRRSLSDRWFRRMSDGPSEQHPDAKLGLRTFHDPPGGADLDILFIHGITGHREHTWAAPGSPPWPEKLLPERLPQARILTFGYDAGVIGWRSRLSGNRIGDHARNLLVGVAAHREVDDTNERPILFVCHSLGGLVCQDALLSSRASPERHLQQILKCTRGILFLGTPHSGTNLAVVGQRLSRLAGLVSGTNTRLVEVLRRDSEVLARIQDDFHSLLRLQGDEIKITCVYEEVPIQGIGEVCVVCQTTIQGACFDHLEQIVPKYSAVLPGYPAIGIHADHRDIARFSAITDPGFIALSNELQRWARELRNTPGKGGPPNLDLGPDLGGFEGLEQAERPSTGIREIAGVTIHGNVLQSVLINGGQVVNGGIVFGD